MKTGFVGGQHPDGRYPETDSLTPAKKAEINTDRHRRSLCFCAHLVREDLAHPFSFTESLVPATAEGKTLQDVQNPVGSS
jgi:hypothetical protein